MIEYIVASIVVFILGAIITEKGDGISVYLGFLMYIAGFTGVLLTVVVSVFAPFASQVNECTESWTVCDNDITLDKLEKVIDDRCIWVLTPDGNRIKRIYITGEIKVEFQDVPVPIIEKWEAYKRYESSISFFRGETAHKVSYHIIIPEEYKEKLDLWCEKQER